MPLNRHPDILSPYGAMAQAAVVSIFAIVVIYKMRPQESATLKTLMQAIDALDAIDPASLKLSILIADNTPGGQSVSDLPSAVRYRAFPANPGLAEPYNLAIAQAREEGYDWLLTLDQDTHLPTDYLADLIESVRRHASDVRVAGIVPRIEDLGIPLSPIHFAGGFFPRVLSDCVGGLLPRNSSALNSASLLRVSALLEIGGYDPRFPLNNSDTALFHRLDAAGYRIAVVGDTVVQHELAIMRQAERMTLDRYRQLLIDECNFWDLHMGPLGRAERLIRLAGRLVKGFVGKENLAFQQVTWSELRKRLFTRRTARLKAMDPIGIPPTIDMERAGLT